MQLSQDSPGAQDRYRLHVPALQPFLFQHPKHHCQGRLLSREPLYDVGSPLDFFEGPLQYIGGAEALPVAPGKPVEGEGFSISASSHLTGHRKFPVVVLQEPFRLCLGILQVGSIEDSPQGPLNRDFTSSESWRLLPSSPPLSA